MNPIKYQNYLHYKLPITMNPLDYGKVFKKIDNKYFFQLNTNNVLIIKKLENENYVKFFRKGELIFEFKDRKISENCFNRTILDQIYTFKNNKLVLTQIINVTSKITIFNAIENYKDTKSVIISPLNSNNKYRNIIKPFKYLLIYKKKYPVFFFLFKLFIILLIYIL